MEPTDIALAGAAEQARMLAGGVITAPALLEVYLERIARLNSELNAYRIVRGENARAEATTAQQRLDAGERLPLLSVPVAIKDDVDVAGEVTAMGTSAHGPAKTQDAELVRRLRAAGAVIIGKTATPELCVWPFTETVSFGPTRNPWDKSAPRAAAAAGRGRSGRGAGTSGGRLRHRRLDPHPGSLVRPVRHQAAARPCARVIERRRLARPDRKRPAEPYRRGCGTLPRRHNHDAGTRRRLRRRGRPYAEPVADCVEYQGPTTTVRPPREAATSRGRRGWRAAARTRPSGDPGPQYPPSAIIANFIPRFLRGITTMSTRCRGPIAEARTAPWADSAG